MTPGPAMRTASELPRKSPVPIAPPMAIILSWRNVSWRDSCSPFSIPSGAASTIFRLHPFIRFAGTTRRIERAQQLDGRSPRILHAMVHAYGEVNAAARREFARFAVGMHNPVAFQNENAFFIRVIVNRGFARRNPSRELRDLFAAEVGVDQVAEQ